MRSSKRKRKLIILEDICLTILVLLLVATGAVYVYPQNETVKSIVLVIDFIAVGCGNCICDVTSELYEEEET